MRIGIHRYELKAQRALSARSVSSVRRGALLQINGGFSDLHPWPELGDLPLDEQLKGLAHGTTTPLSKRSLEFAAADARAREAGRSLFEGLEIPGNHFLATDFTSLDLSRVTRAGFERIKIKVGRDPEAEARELGEAVSSLRGTGLKWRLDFNASLDSRSLAKFLAMLSTDALDALDYIEDPTPFDSSKWESLSNEYRVRFALDRDSSEAPVQGVSVYVVKPALQDESLLVLRAASEMIRLVFGSYLDHPVGQMHAAAVAARVYQSHPLLVDVCGLKSQDAFELNDFSAAIQSEGPNLRLPDGTGIGFDALLEKLPWENLK